MALSAQLLPAGLQNPLSIRLRSTTNSSHPSTRRRREKTSMDASWCFYACRLLPHRTGSVATYPQLKSARHGSQLRFASSRPFRPALWTAWRWKLPDLSLSALNILEKALPIPGVMRVTAVSVSSAARDPFSTEYRNCMTPCPAAAPLFIGHPPAQRSFVSIWRTVSWRPRWHL